MVSSKDILWFKTNFGSEIEQAVAGTPFDVDMLTAIACQETGSLWGPMRKKPELTPERIAALCCGDTLDEDRGRSAFPRTKAHLIAEPNGQKMFDIARAALLAMAEHVSGYEFAKTNKNKFCHGFGVFQYDLQFFRTNPNYFLNHEYEVFGNSLKRALGELNTGLKTLGLQGRSSITDEEFCKIAICYNTGGFKASKGLKQGHKSGDKFYGECIRDFLALSRTVQVTGAPTPVPAPAPSPTGGGITATGPALRVNTNSSNLRLRREAKVSSPLEANVAAKLPNRHPVRAISGNPVNGFIEVQTILDGRLLQGFASADHLVPAGG